MQKPSPSWQRFYIQCQSDFKFWVYFIVLQQIGRLYFIFVLKKYIAPTSKFTTILQVMLHGLRFDSIWATSWIGIALFFFTIPSVFFAISKSNLQKYRYYLGGIFTLATAAIYIASIEYFREYKNLFDQSLFGWFYDDKLAILKTIYKSHHIIPNIILVLGLVFLYAKSSRYFESNRKEETTKARQKKTHSFTYKIFFSIALIVFYLISFRGSIGARPVQMKDAGVTQDAFLNKAVVSPYTALRLAFIEYKEIAPSDVDDKKIAPKKIIAHAKSFFVKKENFATLAKYMSKKARGSSITKPKHIFLILGESLDTWPLLKPYREFNLTPNLQKIIADGIYFKYFLASTYGTMTSLNTIVTGIPDTGLHINYQKSSLTPYVTTLPLQLKKLGFKPQFFYGGYLSWQRVEDFVRAQGFKKVYGAAHIKKWQQTNEWGVDDKTLFAFVKNTIKKEKKPTFNIILTTSNHPPFTIDIDKEGFHKDKVTQLLKKYPPTETTVKELGHIWYADKAIGDFVKMMLAQDNTSLFVITGDHFGRRHILTNPPSFEKSAVPLIIYSQGIKKYCTKNNCDIKNANAGSHIDIGATMIELIAPKGFAYYSLGENLLAKKNHNLGIGQDKIITKDFIVSSNGNESMCFYSNDFSMPCKKPITKEKIEKLKASFEQANCIAKHLIKKGENICAEKKIQKIKT